MRFLKMIKLLVDKSFMHPDILGVGHDFRGIVEAPLTSFFFDIPNAGTRAAATGFIDWRLKIWLLLLLQEVIEQNKQMRYRKSTQANFFCFFFFYQPLLNKQLSSRSLYI